MNKTMNEYQKVSKWMIGAFVLYVITGLVMCIWPNLSMELLGKALGIGMLVVGIVHIILYFTRDHFNGILHMDLTIGVVLASFGAFMLMHSDFVGMAIPFGIGILLLIGGITHIQYALDMRRLYYFRWNICLGIAVLLVAAGLVLLYNPFNEKAMIYFIGGALIVSGISSITCVLLVSHRQKQLAKGWVPKERPEKKAKKGSPDVIDVPAQVITPGASAAAGQNAAGAGYHPANGSQAGTGYQPANGSQAGTGYQAAPGSQTASGFDMEIPEVPKTITLEMPGKNDQTQE